MTTFQMLCVGAFLMAYYYYVLRIYNTLGFRLFSLCFFTGLAVCYWWYTDYRDLTEVRQNGIVTQAIVLKKDVNSLDFRFTDSSGKPVVRTQTGGISIEEFATVQTGRPAPILYSSQSNLVYLTRSYERRLNDSGYFLVFPGLLFLLGIISWICLRKYRVHAHEGTIYEYVTDENGRVVLDDARNSTTKALRTYSTMSKFLEMFEK